LQAILDEALDGNVYTNTEQSTWSYIKDNHKFDSGVKEYLEERLEDFLKHQEERSAAAKASMETEATDGKDGSKNDSGKDGEDEDRGEAEGRSQSSLRNL